jgi:type I restriction enzyme M protein
VFWVPEDARWEALRAQAKQPDIGPRIDAALVTIENDNDSLRGKLDWRFGRAQLEPGRLGELVDLISTIGFRDDTGLQGDPIGKIYEYFPGPAPFSVRSRSFQPLQPAADQP